MNKQMTVFALAATLLFSGTIGAFANEECAFDKCPTEIQKVKPTPEDIKVKMQQLTDKFDAALGLTEEQKAQATQIRTKAQQKMIPLFEKKKAKMQEIRAIRGNDDIKIKVQDEKIEKLKTEIKTIDQEIRQIDQDKRKEFKSILTDEQKTKLEQIRKSNRPHHKMHKKHQK